MTPTRPPPALATEHLARWARLAGWAGALWLLLAAALALWDAQGRWLPPGHSHVTVLKLFIYWGSWATLPWGAQALLQLARRRWRWLPWALGLALVAYSGLIEPRRLQVQHHVVPVPAGAPPLRVALVADLHIGLFQRGAVLARWVDALNALAVDAVLVAGDWSYEPSRDLVAAFAPLARLRHPVFGVLGNHDTAAPGADLAGPLAAALRGHGVRLLDGERAAFRGWELVGLGDLWGADPQADIARHASTPPQGLPRLVIAHQPDTAALLPPSAAMLIVSGHTHGGQIMLPWITQHLVLPGMSPRGWYQGRHATAAGTLVVTPGTGTIGLPARLGVVPRIDVIELRPQ